MIQRIKKFLVDGLVFFAMGLMWVLRFFGISLGLLFYNRAHLIVNTEVWLRTNFGKKKEFIIFFCGKDPWNRQVLTMIKRRLFVIENNFIAKTLIAAGRRHPQQKIFKYLSNTGVYNWPLWNDIPPQLSMTNEEVSRGVEMQGAMGIKKSDRYVCFIARDDAYLDKKLPYADPQAWSYHSFRNSHINNYLKAMDFLTARDYWAIRMGAEIEVAMTTENKRIIDYAKSYRSDFMDIYLSRYCRFFVSDTVGLGVVPDMFNVPRAFVNTVPFNVWGRNKETLFIPKKYWDKTAKRFLTFREIFLKNLDGVSFKELFDKAGIELVENTPEDILGIVQEMHERLEGTWVEDNEAQLLQQKLWDLVPAGHPLKASRARMGSVFLKENQELLG